MRPPKNSLVFSSLSARGLGFCFLRLTGSRGATCCLWASGALYDRLRERGVREGLREWSRINRGLVTYSGSCRLEDCEAELSSELSNNCPELIKEDKNDHI